MEHSSRPPAFCFTFALHGKLYGVDARLVLETVRLPELTPVEDAPGDLAGVVDLRGRVIPALDLGVRLGAGPGSWGLDDWLVVLEREGAVAGLIVHDAQQVLKVPAEAWTVRVKAVAGAVKSS